MRGGLVAGEQQQEHHRHDFIRADPAALFLDAQDFGDQPFPALPPHGFEMTLDVSLHGQHLRDHAEKSHRAGKAGESARPRHEFWAVGERQAEQFANYRQRQFSRIAFDQIGRASFREQFIGKLVAGRQNMRLHVQHGATAKRLVHDVTQPLMVRLVHRQHAVGHRAYDARHPPAHSRDGAVVLADGEGVGVFQHLVGQRLRGGGPDFSDDRKAHLHDRAETAQLFDRRCRVAKILLTGEVDARRHEPIPGQTMRMKMRSASP